MKQIEPVKKSIGDMNFYIRPFPAFKAANISGELADVLAPLFSAVIPIIGEGDLMDIEADKAAELITKNISISGDKLEKLAKKLLLGENIAFEIKGEHGDTDTGMLNEDVVNEIFCGEVQDLFVLCFYVIQINFNGFFKKLGSLSGKLKDMPQVKPRTII